MSSGRKPREEKDIFKRPSLRQFQIAGDSIPFLPGMIALLQKAIPLQTFNELQLTGKRFTARDCEERQIVLKACPREDLMKVAMEFAKGLNKRRGIVAEMKRRTHGDIARVIDEVDPLVIESGVFSF